MWEAEIRRNGQGNEICIFTDTEYQMILPKSKINLITNENNYTPK